MTRRKRKERLDELIGQSFAPGRDAPPSSSDPVWHRTVELFRNAPAKASDSIASGRDRFSSRLLLVAAAVIVITVVSVYLFNGTSLVRPKEGIATDQTTQRPIASGQVVRSDNPGGTLLSLADGSTVELRPKSEILVDRTQNGIRVRLNEGAVFLNVEKQGPARLFVESRHARVSVEGTIFTVEAEATGSRVAVLEGEVLVQYGNVRKQLHAGEQEKTSPIMTAKSLREAVGWSRSAEAYLTVLEEPMRIETPLPAPSASPKQTPPKLSFDANTVRPTPPERVNRLQYERCTGGGRFIAAGLPLMWLIRFGFQVQDREIVGAPDWTNEFHNGFDIQATTERRVTEQECRAMVRSLLEERFQLRSHRETREASVYNLVRGSDKLKLREVTPDDPPGGVRINGAVMQSVSEAEAPAGWPIHTLIGYISGFTGRRVVDKTGLEGLYAFSLDFAITEGDTRQGVFRAVQEQLGLKLEPSREKVEFLVIDHVERPSPN